MLQRNSPEDCGRSYLDPGEVQNKAHADLLESPVRRNDPSEWKAYSADRLWESRNLANKQFCEVARNVLLLRM